MGAFDLLQHPSLVAGGVHERDFATRQAGKNVVAGDVLRREQLQIDATVARQLLHE